MRKHFNFLQFTLAERLAEPGFQLNQLPCLLDLLRRSPLTLTNSHYSVSYQRPYHSNVVEIGGVSMNMAKQLPQVSFSSHFPEASIVDLYDACWFPEQPHHNFESSNGRRWQRNSLESQLPNFPHSSKLIHIWCQLSPFFFLSIITIQMFCYTLVIRN